MPISIFSNDSHKHKTIADKMLDELISQGGISATKDVAERMISLESGNATLHERQDLSNKFMTIRAKLESLMEQVQPAKLGDAKKTSRNASLEAAALSGMLASNIHVALNRKLDLNSIRADKNRVVINPIGGSADMLENRTYATEAYNESENRSAALYTIVYNMQASMQDEFGETWFPTLTISPDKVGIDVEVDLMYVFDGYKAKIENGWIDAKRQNVIRAVVNHNILKKDATRITPVHRAQNADTFIDAATVPPYSLDFEGTTILTAPLKIATKVNLKKASQTEALLANGVLDETDDIDPAMEMTNVYVKIGTNILKINVSNLPTSNFTYTVQGNDRKMTLNFDTTSILINKDTKNFDGSALAAPLDAIVTNDWIVRMSLQMNGHFNIQDGNGVIYANSLEVFSVQNSTGQSLSMSVSPVSTMVAAVASAASNINTCVLGYDVPKAYWSNVNRRQTGQFIDMQRFTQSYLVPLRAPITAKRPTTIDPSVETFDVNTLIQLTRTRIQNEAVTALQNSFALMKNYVDSRDNVGDGPDMLGVGRYFVRPAYMERVVDMDISVDSLTSSARAEDIQATLVNHLRDMAYELYRHSEYKPAADYLQGGPSEVPTVIIGTDPVLARYLTVTGDLRTLGGEFNCRIVSSFDERMAGKIYVGFSSFQDNRNSTIYPLNFGNMIWGPEVVLNANIPRNGALSKETMVQPRYLFVTHCAIGGLITVNNISNVLNKLPVHTHSV